MCSYNAPNMLFPPIELLYLASIAREWHSKDVQLIDSIAEGLSLEETIDKIKLSKADMIVTLSGLEIFEEDIKTASIIKNSFSDTIVTFFGHYATLFPTETLLNSNADYILEGEPDINFSHLLDYFDGEATVEDISGVFYLDEKKTTVHNKGNGRIKRANDLPLPAHDLLKIEFYNEPFLPKPFALIQSARGCPYSCNFCVRSFGKKLALRSPESIIEELQLLKKVHNIKSFRFIDDTFTATKKRIIKLCKLMLDYQLNLKWTCLSRADTLDEEMIEWMSKAGCIRVYIGIESGSPKILKLLNKEIDLKESLANIKLLKKHNIETSAFFMVGHPEETEDDFEMSVQFAIDAQFDYAMAFEFVCYPGTNFFDEFRSLINFNIFPYENSFNDPKISINAHKKVKEFYKRFYFRPLYMGKSIKKLIKHPKETMSNVLGAFKYQVSSINQTRKDYL